MFMLAGGEKAASQLAWKKAGAEAFNRARFLWPVFFYYVFSINRY